MTGLAHESDGDYRNRVEQINNRKVVEELIGGNFFLLLSAREYSFSLLRFCVRSIRGDESK